MTTTQPQKRSRIGLILTAGLVVWVLALIAGIVAVIANGGDGGSTSVATEWSEEVVRPGGSDKIALIEVTGEIVGGHGGDGGAFGVDTLGSDDYVAQLRQALEDPDVVGVVVRLDTPGGSVVPSDNIFRMVEEVDAKKPVIASMADVAASGGYYIAAGARRVFANRATITGSIGVIGVFPNLEGTADKLGVEPIVIKSGPHKDIGSPFRRMTSEERRILQSLIDDAYAQFVDVVARGRNMSEATVRRLADGRVYSGRQALEVKLVDQLGDLDEAIEAARSAAGSADARVVRYSQTIGLADALFGFRGIGKQISSGFDQARRDVTGLPREGLSYIWLP